MSFDIATPQTWKEMLDESAKLFEEMKTIVSDPRTGAEERGKIPAMLADAKDLRERGAQLKNIFDTASEKQDLMDEINKKNTPEKGFHEMVQIPAQGRRVVRPHRR